MSRVAAWMCLRSGNPAPLREVDTACAERDLDPRDRGLEPYRESIDPPDEPPAQGLLLSTLEILRQPNLWLVGIAGGIAAIAGGDRTTAMLPFPTAGVRVGAGPLDVGGHFGLSGAITRASPARPRISSR